MSRTMQVTQRGVEQGRRSGGARRTAVRCGAVAAVLVAGVALVACEEPPPTASAGSSSPTPVRTGTPGPAAGTTPTQESSGADADEPTPAPGPADLPAPAPGPAPAESAPTAPPEAVAPPAAVAPPVDAVPTLPLKDPLVERWDGVTPMVSTAPRSGTSLEDGDFIAQLHGVDLAARTVDVDIYILHTNEYADAWLKEHDPEQYAAIGFALNGYVRQNDVTRIRTLPLADDVRVTRFCFRPYGTSVDDPLTMEELPLDRWASLPAWGGLGSERCGAAEPGRGEDYWLDVRGGEVVQLVGQYYP